MFQSSGKTIGLFSGMWNADALITMDVSIAVTCAPIPRKGHLLLLLWIRTNGVRNTRALVAFLIGELDHENAVLGHDSDQQNEADLAVDIQ